jgi:hypothetical protein
MDGWLGLVAFVAIWILLQTWVLPRLNKSGVPT